jgi:spermidine synthase
MSLDFEELAYSRTPLGELSLRRRRYPALAETDVFEIKLGDEFLMSSLFTEGETALVELGLAGQDTAPLDVVVGGLGLGYTARAALDSSGVRSVLVIEALAAVIDWHLRGLVPLGKQLTADPRCSLIHGDFFAMASPSGEGFDPRSPGRRFHAVLLDIDHSPRHLLHSSHRVFYETAGLHRLAHFLHPDGVFALWSNDPPDDEFLQSLAKVFATSRAHTVKFHNAMLDCEAANTVYVARKAVQHHCSDGMDASPRQRVVERRGA